MVHVLTAHHFGGQDIQTCEDPVAAAPIKPSRLLIALARHVVEVRDLEAGGAVTTTFPTADKVALIEHCKTGNYVVTLEGKFRYSDNKVRNVRESAAVRVYTNWETGLEPMRARIAGRVTPSRCETNSLEMIEIPVKRPPTGFACCQTTGNILVTCLRTLFLYTYSVHKNEAAHLTYIDFNDSQLSLALSFAPLHVHICEDLIATSGRHTLLVCRLSPERSRKKTREEDEKRPSRDDDDTLSMKRLLKMERDILLGKIRSSNFPLSFPLTVHLPSVVAERASRGNCSPGSGIVPQSNPFVADPVDVKVSVSCSWEMGAQMETLLRIQLAGDQTGNVEQFGSLVIQPVYSLTKNKSEESVGLSSKAWPLHSPHRDNLCSVAVLVATQQEGYLYHFAMDGRMSIQPCVSIYPFTAPVTTVVLESCALHALTETGLETYTLRSYHRTLAKIQDVSLPEDDPISLIGLRPFLGVKQLLVTDWQLVLLASPDGNHNIPPESKTNLWTLYSLKLPGPEVLFSDMLAVGESHKIVSPMTYRQLLAEAHCIIARYHLLHPSIPDLASPPSRECSYDALKSLYRKSCVLLADYLVISDNRDEIDVATKWYYRSGLPLTEVIERINKNVAGRIEADESDEEGLSLRIHRARCYFLFNVLTDCRKKRDRCYKNEYIEAICKDDQTCRFLANSVLDEFEKQLPPGTVESPTDYLSYLVLISPIPADYALQRTLDLLQQLTTHKKDKDAKSALALILLLVQQGNYIEGKVNKVSDTLRGIESEDFVKVVSDFWEILIDHNQKENRLTFSETAAVLMEHKPMEMASLLAKLVMENSLSLEQLPKMLISLMSSRLGKSSRLGHVFQRFLELFFDSYFSQAEPPPEMNTATHEALKILVRTYLSDLQISNSNSSSSNHHTPSRFILLERSRHTYLDAMPPFGPAINELLSAPRKTNKTSESNNNNNNSRSATIDTRSLSLKKLQSLLCSGRLTDDCFKETLMFIGGNPHLYGNLSLQVLCMKVPEGVNVIVEYCPKAALRYGQEVLAPDKWRLLIDALIRKIESLSYGEGGGGKPLTAERDDRSSEDSTSGTGTITPKSDETDAITEAETATESVQNSSEETEANKLVPMYDDVLADVLEYLSGQLTVEEFWDLLSTTKAFNTPCAVPAMKSATSGGTRNLTLVHSNLEPSDRDAVLKYHDYLLNCLHNENARIVQDCLISTGNAALAELYP